MSEKIKHRPMGVPHVSAVAKFGDVFPSVLARNVNMRALYGAFEQRPMTFQAVHVMDAAHVFLGRMIDGAMIVTVAKALIGTPFVRADRAARLYVLVDDAL